MSLITTLGLVVPAGLNAYIPLLAVSLSQRFGLLELRRPFDMLGEWWAIAMIVVRISQENDYRLMIYSASYVLGQLAALDGDLRQAGFFLGESLKMGFQNPIIGANQPFNELTSLAVQLQEMELAARLFGAASCMVHGFTILSPTMRSRREADQSAVRAALGERRFEQCSEEGRRMSLRQAVTLALEVAGGNLTD